MRRHAVRALPADSFDVEEPELPDEWQDDERQDGRRYFLPESMARIDAVPESEEVNPTLLMAS